MDNLLDALQALDRRVDEMTQTIRHLKNERDQLKAERDRLKELLDQTQHSAQEAHSQWEESRRKQDELTHLVNSVGADRAQLRERIQSILSKLDELEN